MAIVALAWTRPPVISILHLERQRVVILAASSILVVAMLATIGLLARPSDDWEPKAATGPSQPFLHSVCESIEQNYRRIPNLSFQGRLIVENNLGEEKRYEQRTAKGFTLVRFYPRAEAEFNFLIAGGDIRRETYDKTRNRKEITVINRGRFLKVVEYPDRKSAWFRKQPEVGPVPLDPRHFGLEPNSNSLSSWLRKARILETQEREEELRILAVDNNDVLVRLALSREYGWLPTEVSYWLKVGCLREVSWLSYQPVGKGAWFPKVIERRLFSNGEAMDTESQGWSSRVTFTIAEVTVNPSYPDKDFDVVLAKGTVLCNELGSRPKVVVVKADAPGSTFFSQNQAPQNGLTSSPNKWMALLFLNITALSALWLLRKRLSL